MPVFFRPCSLGAGKVRESASQLKMDNFVVAC